MGALSRYVGAIGRSIVTLGDGLAVTFSYLFRKPITIQYPDRTPEPVSKMLPERSRGILEVDIEICTGCSMCAKQCPIDCLHVTVEKDEATKQRLLAEFDIDAGKCMFCGLCVESCPTGAIRHSHEFEGAMGDVKRLLLHFVDEPRPVAKPPKKGEEAPKKPLGSLVRPLLADALRPAEPRKPRPKPAAPKPAPQAKPAVQEKKEDTPPSLPKSETAGVQEKKSPEQEKPEGGGASEDKGGSS